MQHQPSNSPSPGGKRRKTGQIRTARQLRPLEGNKIRVRSKRLDTVDQDQLSLAYWLLAKAIVKDHTDEPDAPAPHEESPAADEGEAS